MVATLTFSVGIGVTCAANFPLNLTISLAFFVGVPVLISAIVLYQGACLHKPWRPAIGKAFLAALMWILPSLIVVGVNLVSYVDSLDPQPIGLHSFGTTVVLSFFTGGYGFIGWTLCHWVSRYDLGNHWLLRNQDSP